jgi:DNA repair exonuclease SbcCD ATPase subunit
MIRPLYIELKNFCSFGNKLVHIDFPGPGEKMLIRGSVGSGKTSIITALAYNISGKKIGGTNIVNTINKKGLYTEVAWVVPGLDDPLIIKRGMKPSIFEISGVSKTLQKELKKELDKRIHITDPQVLLNLCLLSTSKSLPFFSLKKQERLNFLRNFVDTTKLDDLSEKAKTINLDINKTRNVLQGEVDTISTQLTSIKTKLENRLTIDAEKIEVLDPKTRCHYEEAIELYEYTLEAMEYDYAIVSGMAPSVNEPKDEEHAIGKYAPLSQKRICEETIGELERGLNEVEEDLQQVRSIQNELSGQIRSVNQSILAAEEDAKGITSDSCKKYFNGLIDSYRDKAAELERDLSVIVEHLGPIKETKEDLVDKIKVEEQLLAKQKNQIFKAIQQQKEDLAEMKAIINEDDQNIALLERAEAEKSANQELIDLGSETEKLLIKKKEALAEAERLFLVSKEYRSILDNTWGYMANRMVPYLNQRLPFYMEELNMDFIMQLDPRDISKPIFKGRPGVGSLKLEDLSTGQKGLTSIALAHSLRDLEAATQGVDVGFLAIDELSSNMDVDKVDELMDFEINYIKKHGIAFILITHDVALQNREWDHIIDVDRTNFSTVTKVK